MMRFAIVGPTLVGILVCLFLTAFIPPATADKKPLFVRVAVVPFTVEPQPFAGAPTRSDQAKLVSKLEEEATKQSSRSLIEHNLAGEVQPAAKFSEAQAPFVLSGIVRLPISLPERVYGLDAYERSGQFATAIVTVKHLDGTILATGEARLTWKACWWITGPRSRRNLPVDDVLADFVRKAADRATQVAVNEASKKEAQGMR